MQYGFELEGFFFNEQGEVSIPPEKYPVDVLFLNLN